MPIITISRGSLSGGQLLASQLASRLGFKVISREVIVESAKKYEISEDQLREGMEEPPGLWARITHQRDQYVIAMRATLSELLDDSDVVYHGHAGQLLLKGLPNVIKVRLIAPLQYRLRSATIEHGLSGEEAQRHIVELDEKRRRWARRMYDVDVTDPSLYDLVINLEHMSIETATDVVAAMAEKSEYSHTPESDQQVRDFALKSRIVAELVLRSPFPPDIVEVDVRSGVVDLKGGGLFDAKKEEVVQFVRNIRGVKELTPDVGVAASPGTGTGVPSEETAADVMLSISSYPQVPQWLSIWDAIAALSTSSIKLNDGHEILPRYVLVTDEQERLVGVLTRRDMLKGLSIQLRTLEKAQKELRSVVAGQDLSYSVSFRWISFFNRSAVESSRETVKSIMAPVVGTVRPDQSVSTVVTTMIQNGIDLVPVMDGQRAVGAILMTDVFDRVSQYILEHGGKR